MGDFCTLWGIIDYFKYQVEIGNPFPGKMCTHTYVVISVTLHGMLGAHRIPRVNSPPLIPDLDSLEVTSGIIFPNFLLGRYSNITEKLKECMCLKFSNWYFAVFVLSLLLSPFLPPFLPLLLLIHAHVFAVLFLKISCRHGVHQSKIFQHACHKNKIILLHRHPQEMSSDVSWYPGSFVAPSLLQECVL